MDREKIMSWLEGLAEPDWRECYSNSEVQETARQALDLIDELLKEQEPYISKETRLNRDEYCRVGDVLDCFDGMDMKADEVFHAVCLIEWAMSKRSVPLDQLLKEQEETIRNLEQEIRDKNERLKERAEQVDSMLKEQEPVEPSRDIALNRRCPKCFAILKGKFCHKCGQAVKWDD